MIRGRVQNLMDIYKTGLEVTSVNMQPAKPPEQVKEAFDDAIKAREDKERLENKSRGLCERNSAASTWRGSTYYC